jgi:hypothetical protein
MKPLKISTALFALTPACEMMTKVSSKGREATFEYMRREIRLFEDTEGYCYYVMKISGQVIRSHFYDDSPSALGAAKEWIEQHEASQAEII